jgi:dTDP-4-dehydrorhamnose reductase
VKTVLVTGRHGQVAEALHDLRQEFASLELNLVFGARPEFDFENEAALLKAVAGVQPDIIVNAAAFTMVDQAEDDQSTADQINHQSPALLANYCDERKIPFVHISTDYVFDGTKDSPYVEADSLNPQTVYGRTKADAEIAIRDRCADHIILRTAWVYSDAGKNFVKTMLRLGASRDELKVVSDQFGNPTSARQIALAIKAVLTQWKGGTLRLGETYHVVADGVTNWFEFARHIFEVSEQARGPSCTVHPIPTSEYPTPTPRPANSALNNEKFITTFGHVIGEWQMESERIVRSLIENGQAPND